MFTQTGRASILSELLCTLNLQSGRVQDNYAPCVCVWGAEAKKQECKEQWAGAGPSSLQVSFVSPPDRTDTSIQKNDNVTKLLCCKGLILKVLTS